MNSVIFNTSDITFTNVSRENKINVPRETFFDKQKYYQQIMNTALLLKNLRNVPDFPIPGIQFKDVSTLFNNSECLAAMVDELVERYKGKGITKVVGLESRGFVIGAIVAARLNCGFVMCRKPGKLPASTIKETYGKEYGTDTLEIHTDAISPDDTVLIHDDLLATGGSMLAAYNLVSKFSPKNIYMNCIIELKIEGLNGRAFIGEEKHLDTLLVINE